MSEPLDLSELSPAAREALEFLKENLKVKITVSLCDEVISESNDLIEFPDP